MTMNEGEPNPKGSVVVGESQSGLDDGQFRWRIGLFSRTHGFSGQVAGRPAAIDQPVGQTVVFRHQSGDENGGETDGEPDREAGRMQTVAQRSHGCRQGIGGG